MSLKQIIDIAYKVIPSDLLDKFEEKVNKNSERFLETLIYELILGCNNENFNDVSKALDLITSLETYSEEIENMITEAIKNKNYPSKCNITLYERFDMSFDIRFLESYTRQYLVTESDSDEEICLKDFSEALLRNVFKASLNESGYENIEAFFYRYNNTASNISEREWIEINKIFIEDNISLFKEIFENSFKDSIESNSKSILKLIKQSIIYEAIEIFKYLLSKLLRSGDPPEVSL